MIWIKASLKRWGPRLEDRIFWWANAFRLMCLIQSTKKQKERVAHTVPWNKRRQTQTMRYPRSLPFRWHWTDYPLLTTLTTLFKLLKYFLVTIHGTEYKNARQIKLLVRSKTLEREWNCPCSLISEGIRSQLTVTKSGLRRSTKHWFSSILIAIFSTTRNQNANKAKAEWLVV